MSEAAGAVSGASAAGAAGPVSPVSPVSSVGPAGGSPASEADGHREALRDVLRKAIEVAFVVAVTGARARPPITPPAALKPYLRFQRLPAAALEPVRRSVEGDAEFRQRVADVATEELVGRAGWLWLHRPEGWTDELEHIAHAATRAAAAEANERDERWARKRLDAAEQATSRATAEAARARAEADAARDEVDAERRARRTAEDAVDRLERRRAQLEVELGGARRRVEEGEQRIAEALIRAEHAETDLAAARNRIVELAAALEDAERRAAAGAEIEAERDVIPLPDRAPAPRRRPSEDDSGPLDRDRLSVVLERAASATAALAEALGDAAALVEPPPPPALPEAPPPPAVRPAHPPVRRVPRAPRPRRTPLALPGGVMGDSVTAAEHLVKADRVLLIVDGYNAAKLAWPGEPLSEQRVRLLDLVDELVMRHGTDTKVVFDGADIGCSPSLGRRLAKVTFSPPGTPADDVIVDLVRRLPAERPVVVATNDRAVRAAARSGGANLISSEQLLAVARR